MEWKEVVGKQRKCQEVKKKRSEWKTDFALMKEGKNHDQNGNQVSYFLQIFRMTLVRRRCMTFFRDMAKLLKL